MRDNYARGVLAIAICMLIILAMSSSAVFDACIYTNSIYHCSNWPDLGGGLIYSLVLLFFAPKNVPFVTTLVVIPVLYILSEPVRFGLRDPLLLVEHLISSVLIQTLFLSLLLGSAYVRVRNSNT